jgi:hypothetical protein
VFTNDVSSDTAIDDANTDTAIDDASSDTAIPPAPFVGESVSPDMRQAMQALGFQVMKCV